MTGVCEKGVQNFNKLGGGGLSKALQYIAGSLWCLEIGNMACRTCGKGPEMVSSALLCFSCSGSSSSSKTCCSRRQLEEGDRNMGICCMSAEGVVERRACRLFD